MNENNEGMNLIERKENSVVIQFIIGKIEMIQQCGQ